MVDHARPHPPLALTGVRVIDATDRRSAGIGRMLIDLGADVVTVRAPGAWTSENAGTRFLEAGARMVELDLGTEASVARCAALAEATDVVLLSPTPDRPVAGLSAAPGARLSWAPPGAVVLAVTPFGLAGPLSGWSSTDATAGAMAGLLSEAPPGGSPPVPVPFAQLDGYVCLHAVIAVLAALRDRDAGAGGAMIDLAAHDVLAGMNFAVAGGASCSALPERTASRVEYGGVWECLDGPVDVLVSTPRQWSALLSVIGTPPALADPSLAAPRERAAREGDVSRALERALSRLTRDEFVSSAQAAGVAATKVHAIPEFVADRHMTSRGFFVPVSAESGPEPVAPGAPFHSDPPLADPARTRVQATGPEDVAEIAREWGAPRPSRPRARGFADLKVLSLGTVVAGGLIGSLLADLGADVVKIESTRRPDQLRTFVPPGRAPAWEPAGVPTSPVFAAVNRSVRGIDLDLTADADRELFLDLVDVADVLVDNFSPRVMTRLGLDGAALAERNPALVQLSLSGFGHSGTHAHFAAYGATVCGYVGLTHEWGRSSQTLYDYVAHAQSAVGVLAGLAMRDRTGAGVVIDVAMVEAAATVMAPALVERATASPSRPADASRWMRVLRCGGADRWLVVEVRGAAELDALSALVGHAPAARVGGASLEAAVESWLRDKAPFEAARSLQAAGIAASPVQDCGDLRRDPQLAFRGAIVEIPHPDLGRLVCIPSVHRRASAAPARAPRLGEHQHVVMDDWLRHRGRSGAARTTAGDRRRSRRVNVE